MGHEFEKHELERFTGGLRDAEGFAGLMSALEATETSLKDLDIAIDVR